MEWELVATLDAWEAFHLLRRRAYEILKNPEFDLSIIDQTAFVILMNACQHVIGFHSSVDEVI